MRRKTRVNLISAAVIMVYFVVMLSVRELTNPAPRVRLANAGIEMQLALLANSCNASHVNLEAARLAAKEGLISNQKLAEVERELEKFESARKSIRINSGVRKLVLDLVTHPEWEAQEAKVIVQNQWLALVKSEPQLSRWPCLEKEFHAHMDAMMKNLQDMFLF